LTLKWRGTTSKNELSDFIRYATPEQKDAVFGEVIDRSIKRQNEVKAHAKDSISRNRPVYIRLRDDSDTDIGSAGNS
jgi:hypothetical protein